MKIIEIPKKKSWNKLSFFYKQLFIQKISNGCGGKGGLVKPPYKTFFKASCDAHDYGYSVGGTIRDKIKADLGLFRRMNEDVNIKIPLVIKVKGKIKTQIIKNRYYKLWTYLYLISVSIFGLLFFNWGSKGKIIVKIQENELKDVLRTVYQI